MTAFPTCIRRKDNLPKRLGDWHWGGEEVFQAKEDLASLFLRIDTIRLEKMKRLETKVQSGSGTIDIELDAELDEDSNLALMD